MATERLTHQYTRLHRQTVGGRTALFISSAYVMYSLLRGIISSIDLIAKKN